MYSFIQSRRMHEWVMNERMSQLVIHAFYVTHAEFILRDLLNTRDSRRIHSTWLIEHTWLT